MFYRFLDNLDLWIETHWWIDIIVISLVLVWLGFCVVYNIKRSQNDRTQTQNKRG